MPMFNEHPIELGIAGHEAEIVAALRDARRRAVVSRPRSPPIRIRSRSSNIVRAIAAFERTLLSADSPFDRYLYRDDRTAISRSGGPRA